MTAVADTATTGSIVGTVVGPDGTPLAEQVWVGVDAYWTPTESGTGNHTTVAPASDGTFRFDGIAPGLYRVWFRHQGTAPVVNVWWGGAYFERDAQILRVSAGQTSVADARLELGGFIQGHVRDDQGQPVQQRYYTINEVPDPVTAQLNSPSLWGSPDGSYRSSVLPPGSYTIALGGPGSRWWTENENGVHLGSGAPLGKSVTIAPGQTVTIDAQLERTPAIEGTVTVDSANGPVPWAGHYVWERPYGSTGNYEDSTFTDAQGHYSLVGLAPGDYEVHFEGEPENNILGTHWPDSQSPDGALPVTVGADQVVTGIDATLRRGGQFSGRVLLRSTPGAPAEPQESARITIWRLDDTSGAYVPMPYGDHYTDRDGRFQALALLPGKYAIYSYTDDLSVGGEYYDGARYFMASTDIDVGAGDSIDIGDVTLKPRYFDVGRIAGADRYETAVRISQQTVPDGTAAPVVYIANGSNFPDALSAGPAAIARGGVVLLVAGDVIPSVVIGELKRLHPERIVIAGGPSVVSSAVEARLRTYVHDPSDVRRIGGSDRYETSALIVRDAFGNKGAEDAFIATGGNYPDALAAGPAAGHVGAPVLLVNGDNGALSATATGVLRDLAVKHAYIAGGPAVVNPGIETSLATQLGSASAVTRFAGSDRFSTAAAMNAEIFTRSDYAFISTGVGFADAVAGGPIAGAYDAPLYLAQPTCLPAPAAAGLWDQRVAGVLLLGGTSILSPALDNLQICK